MKLLVPTGRWADHFGEEADSYHLGPISKRFKTDDFKFKDNVLVRTKNSERWADSENAISLYAVAEGPNGNRTGTINMIHESGFVIENGVAEYLADSGSLIRIST